MKADYPLHQHGEVKAAHFRDVTLGRLDRFEGYLSDTLFEARDDTSNVVSLSVWHAPGLTKPSFQEAVKAKHWQPLKKGDSFGPSSSLA
jgi:alpha-mannosidase